MAYECLRVALMLLSDFLIGAHAQEIARVCFDAHGALTGAGSFLAAPPDVKRKCIARGASLQVQQTLRHQAACLLRTAE